MPAVVMPAALRLGTATPEDAIAAFVQRELLAPSFRWQDVWQDEHARAFAVAGVMRDDVLKVFKDELELTVREGRSLKDFAQRIRPALAKKGFGGPVDVTDPDTGEQRTIEFTDARLRTIFDVNMRQSHAAGRWARIERDKRRRPLVMYRTMRDERVRASHAAWDGLVLPVDHPFWAMHYPPNGWRCRCTAYALSEADLKRRLAAGEKLKTEVPPEQLVTYVNPRTGEIAAIPHGVDPGFAYNPGKGRDAALYDQVLRKSIQSYPLAAALAVALAQADFPAMVKAAAKEFSDWVDTLDVTSSRPRLNGSIKYVGVLHPAALRALQHIGREPASTVIAVRDSDVLHAVGTRKTNPKAGTPADRKKAAGTPINLPLEQYKRLPELLANPQGLLLGLGDGGRAGPAILVVVDIGTADGKLAKAVIKLDELVRLSRLAPSVPLNIARTVTMVLPQALADRTRYQWLLGAP